MLYIDPDLCKDCETCIKACPENAIFRENELPEEWIPYKELNAEMAKQCPQFERKAG
jgi:ferredoxin